jgi:hypothetical protein
LSTLLLSSFIVLNIFIGIIVNSISEITSGTANVELHSRKNLSEEEQNKEKLLEELKNLKIQVEKLESIATSIKKSQK